MELTMTNSFGFCELNEQEMMMVDGGGPVTFFSGVAIVAGTVLAVAMAPVSVPIVSVAGAAACVAGFAGGYIAGTGIATGNGTW